MDVPLLRIKQVTKLLVKEYGRGFNCEYSVINALNDHQFIGIRPGHIMMTSSNGTIFRVTGPLCGEFTGPGEFPAQWPVTRSFDVFFDLSLNKRLSKQSWGWWFETPPWPLWRHRNDGDIQHWRVHPVELNWVWFYMKLRHQSLTLIARFMGLTWGPSGADRTQVGPMLAPWTLLSGKLWLDIIHAKSHPYLNELIIMCITILKKQNHDAK